MVLLANEQCVINIYLISLYKMTVVEDSSSAPDHDEDQLDKQVGEMIALSEVTCNQVCIDNCQFL